MLGMEPDHPVGKIPICWSAPAWWTNNQPPSARYTDALRRLHIKTPAGLFGYPFDSEPLRSLSPFLCFEIQLVFETACDLGP